ncbi:MAG: flagellar protein FlaG [Pseudomonadota bacterium]
MLVEPISISGKATIPVEQARLSVAKAAPQEFNTPQEGGQELNTSQLTELVADLQKNLELMHNVNLQFSVHEASGQMQVTITDEETGQVVREIPPSEILNLAAKVDEMIGMLLDQKG